MILRPHQTHMRSPPAHRSAGPTEKLMLLQMAAPAAEWAECPRAFSGLQEANQHLDSQRHRRITISRGRR